MKSLHYRKAHRSTFSHLPRIASFIGTSNKTEILNDPTGSRRYLCIELNHEIDCTTINHEQIYAQLKHELRLGQRIWLTTAEEEELTHHNSKFYAETPLYSAFFRCFDIGIDENDGEFLCTAEIYDILKNRFPSVSVGMNIYNFGRFMATLGLEKVHGREGNMYRVRRKVR